MGGAGEAGVKWYASFSGHFYWTVVPSKGIEEKSIVREEIVFVKIQAEQLRRKLYIHTRLCAPVNSSELEIITTDNHWSHAVSKTDEGERIESEVNRTNLGLWDWWPRWICRTPKFNSQIEPLKEKENERVGQRNKRNITIIPCHEKQRKRVFQRERGSAWIDGLDYAKRLIRVKTENYWLWEFSIIPWWKCTINGIHFKNPNLDKTFE